MSLIKSVQTVRTGFPSSSLMKISKNKIAKKLHSKPMINLCSQVNCVHGTCKSSSTHFECKCHPGWTHASDGICTQDIDECDTAETKCHHNCQNTPGSFKARQIVLLMVVFLRKMALYCLLANTLYISKKRFPRNVDNF